MTTTINNNEYVDGKRVCNQTITYTKADDIQTLGRLQISLAATLSQLDKMTGAEPTHERFVANKTAYENAITAQQAIVDGYSTEV